MGVCKYCGKPAGFLRSYHPECHAKHLHGKAKIKELIQDAIESQRSIHDFYERIREISIHSFIPNELFKEILVTETKNTLKNFYFQKRLTEEIKEYINQLFDFFKIDGEILEEEYSNYSSPEETPEERNTSFEINKLTSQDTNIPLKLIDNDELLKEIVSRLDIMSDALVSPYLADLRESILSEEEIEERKNQMLSNIEAIEKIASQRENAIVKHKLGIAYRNFSTWFTKGEERKIYLKKMVQYFKKALELDPNYVPAKVNLVDVLINEKSIRDLPLALQLAEELKNQGEYPSWLDASLQKAKRWQGNIELPEDFLDFSNISIYPAVLDEERKNLRALIRFALKNTDMELAKKAGLRLYNLALLVTYLYRDYNVKTGFVGYKIDEAKKIFEKIKNKFRFQYMGFIEGGGFLSKRDYSYLEKIFEKTEQHVNVRELINF